MDDQFVIGLDYGTDSVRALLVDARGREIASSVFTYPRWRDGLYCNATINQFRQHPLDYIEGLEATIKSCISSAGKSVAAKIKGISVDTTGSTPVAVDKRGTPLALLPGLEENPNGMFVLWKDHTSIREAEEINQHAARYPVDYLKYVGGIYSSEWFWAKLLHVIREDDSIQGACYSWVEHCDWIPFLLTGGTDVHKLKRSRCAAGHKALWAAEFGGLPPDEFFASLDPLLKGFTARLFTDTYTSDKPAGIISPTWARRLGVPDSVVIGVGAFDAHMGAVGGQIEPYYLSKVMGTSTCDMLVAPPENLQDRFVRGICGQVDGSVLPGMIGLEAGQSAFGDTYAWFRDLLSWPINTLLKKQSGLSHNEMAHLRHEMISSLIPALSEEAASIPLHDENVLAIDWLNGRRTPDADQTLKGAITGLGLGSTAPHVFNALVESTCFGARAIVERFRSEGVDVKGLIGLGGVARKSPYIMQVLADVINMPIRIHRSEQTCALGAAMFAAVAASIHPSVEVAMNEMGQGFDQHYVPNAKATSVYERRYKKYLMLGEQLRLIGTSTRTIYENQLPG